MKSRIGNGTMTLSQQPNTDMLTPGKTAAEQPWLPPGSLWLTSAGKSCCHEVEAHQSNAKVVDSH